MTGRKRPLPVAAVLLTRAQIQALLENMDVMGPGTTKAEEEAFNTLGRALARLEDTRCECGGRKFIDTARILKHNLSERHQEYLRFSGKAPSIGKVTE